MAETIWPAEPDVFIIWPFKKKLLIPGLGGQDGSRETSEETLQGLMVPGPGH